MNRMFNLAIGYSDARFANVKKDPIMKPGKAFYPSMKSDARNARIPDVDISQVNPHINSICYNFIMFNKYDEALFGCRINMN